MGILRLAGDTFDFRVEQHFWQIQGFDGAPCSYLMWEDKDPAVLPVAHLGTDSFDNQMIKIYPIVNCTKLFSNMALLDMEPPLNMYTCKAAEDNTCCFQELKCILQGNEDEEYLDKFNLHSEFQAAWRKLDNNFLWARAKDTHASDLKNTI